MDSDDFLRAVQTKAAMQVFENLAEDERKAIYTNAIRVQFDRLNIGYETGRMLEAEMLKYAADYIITPEVQESIKQAAHVAVDEVLKGITKAAIVAVEEQIKSKYACFTEEARKRTGY